MTTTSCGTLSFSSEIETSEYIDKSIMKYNSTIDPTLSTDAIIDPCSQLLKCIFPDWNISNIIFEHCTNGITNKLMKCYCPDDNISILIRIYGKKSEILINRKQELVNFVILTSKNLSPPLYARFNNGFIYGFLEGNALTHLDLRDKRIMELVAKKLSEWHKIDLPAITKPLPTLLSTLNRWFNYIQRRMKDFSLLHFSSQRNQNEIKMKSNETQKSTQDHDSNKCHFSLDFNNLISFIESQLLEIKNQIESLNDTCPIAFCHNDLLAPNIILHPNQKSVGLIDFEYASYNYIAFDIANHFCEWAGFDCDYQHLMPTEKEQFEWINLYLKYNDNYHKITANDLYNQVQVFIKASHLFWGLWSLIQSQVSVIEFDYIKYGSKRLNRLEEIISSSCH